MLTIDAEPYSYEMDPYCTAFIVVDRQSDFVSPGGFGEMLGNDVSQLQKAIPPTIRVLEAVRKAGLKVIHIREGHRTDLSDCPPSKMKRGKLKVGIGDPGPMGRVLIRGNKGHAIIEELKPLSSEPVIDKPGKGAFYNTDLDGILHNWGTKYLVVAGVTTEVCIHTTVREANDRGYECLVLADCVASYFPEFHKVGLEMIKAQGGIFGWVSYSETLIAALLAVSNIT